MSSIKSAKAGNRDHIRKFFLKIAPRENSKATTICNEINNHARESMHEYDLLAGNITLTEPITFALELPSPSRLKLQTLEPPTVASGPDDPFKWTGKNTAYRKSPGQTAEDLMETTEDLEGAPKTYGWTPINISKPKPSRRLEIRAPLPVDKTKLPDLKLHPNSPVLPGSEDTASGCSTDTMHTISRTRSKTATLSAQDNSPINKDHIAAISGLDFSQMYAWRIFPEEQKQVARNNVLREYPHWTDDEVEARLKSVTTSRNMSSARRQGDSERRERKRRKASEEISKRWA